MFQYETEPLENQISASDYVRDYVDVPRFLECCRACPNYGNKWSCPPYDFNPLDLWAEYKTLRLFGTKITLGEKSRLKNYDDPETRESLRGMFVAEKKKLLGRVLALEKENTGSRALSAGSCDICRECAKKSGEPCRRSEKMRYSIEALGGNVGKTAEKLLGVEIKWAADGKLPGYFMLVCGILTK